MKIVPYYDSSPLSNGTDNLGPDQQGWDPSNPVIVSQTQEAIGNSPNLSSENEEGCIDIQVDNPEFGTVAAQISSVFDNKDAFLSAEIEAITDHCYIGSVLGFNLEYTNGDISWHPITVMKDEDPHVIDTYIIVNNLVPSSNGIHGHYARKFLRFLKRAMRRLHICDFNGFNATSYQPSPRNVAFLSLSK